MKIYLIKKTLYEHHAKQTDENQKEKKQNVNIF